MDKIISLEELVAALNEKKITLFTKPVTGVMRIHYNEGGKKYNPIFKDVELKVVLWNKDPHMNNAPRYDMVTYAYTDRSSQIQNAWAGAIVDYARLIIDLSGSTVEFTNFVEGQKLRTNDKIVFKVQIDTDRNGMCRDYIIKIDIDKETFNSLDENEKKKHIQIISDPMNNPIHKKEIHTYIPYGSDFNGDVKSYIYKPQEGGKTRLFLRTTGPITYYMSEERKNLSFDKFILSKFNINLNDQDINLIRSNVPQVEDNNEEVNENDLSVLKSEINNDS